MVVAVPLYTVDSPGLMDKVSLSRNPRKEYSEQEHGGWAEATAVVKAWRRGVGLEGSEDRAGGAWRMLLPLTSPSTPDGPPCFPQNSNPV